VTRAAAAAALLLAASCAALAPGAGDPGTAAVAEVAALANAERAAAGCPALRWLEGAARAAQAHSDDMARRGYFGHRSPEGVGFSERLAREGVAFRAGAENLALDPGAPRDVLSGWLRSAPHRQNLLDCRYTHHGLGERRGRWTHLLLIPVP
jgi:uncharacterized protein YkwD